MEAFRKIDQTTDFPEMSRLLSELQNYRGDGMAAKLFYESKVAEALSLVVEYQKKGPPVSSKLSAQDLERIQTVAAYLSDHYAAKIPMERLTQIACMGTTKLKSSFKKVYDCTITEYIQQRRMSQAEYLLTSTDLPIGQIAQTVGYSTSSRFAELFRKSTGAIARRVSESLDAGDETSINIPRRSRGFFIDGQSPMILATRHVTLVRPDIRVLSLSATRKRVF